VENPDCSRRVPIVDKYGQSLPWDIVGPITKDSLVALLPVGTHWLRFSIGTDTKTVTIQRINKNPWTDVVNVNYTPGKGR
jgi:hypothetical protein